MAKGKKPEAHFKRARARSAQEVTGMVDDILVLKILKDITKRCHWRQLALWYRFEEDNLESNPVVSVHNLKWMKQFVKHVALGMGGQRGYNDSNSDVNDEGRWRAACVESIRSY